MKTTTITTNGGNRLELARLGAGLETLVTVTDRDGELVATWQGEIPAELEQTLEAASFRHVARCQVCGGAFRAKRSTASTCSAKCRTKLWRQRSTERAAS